MEHVLLDGDTLTLEEVDSRGTAVRLRDGFAKLLSPYL